MPESRFDFDFDLLHDVLYQDKDYEVSRLDDLGGFPDCLIPDGGVGVGEGSFGGVEPGGDQGPPLNGDGGAPALVEVADGEDTVFVAGLGEGVLDFLEELWEPGWRCRGDRLAQGGERQGGHGNQRFVTSWVLGSHLSPPPLTSSNRIGRARPRGGSRLLEMAGPIASAALSALTCCSWHPVITMECVDRAVGANSAIRAIGG